MFKDILGKANKDIDWGTWILSINNKDCEVEVFNVTMGDKYAIEGYIKDSDIVIDIYTSYVISVPGRYRIFTVIMERIDKDTLKFYVPEDK